MWYFKCHRCALLILGTVVTHGSAASYQYVNIVDDAGPFRFFGGPAINNSGTVAFHAVLDNFAGEGIFIGGGGAITTLYDSSGPFDGLGDADINDSGTVVFGASFDAGGGGLFTGNGGPTTTITSYGEGMIEINNQETVAFNTSQGVFVGSGGPITTIADTSGPFDNNLNVRSINDSGTVGFYASLDGDLAGEGIFIGSGGPITTVALSGENYPYAQVQDVHVNNAGTVAFMVAQHEGDGGGQVIFLGSPGSTTIVADTYGPYQLFPSDIGFNNNNQVAFKARLDADGEGIFTGPDPLADKVIQIGDPLFGSTLSFIVTYALNDNGEIAFRYNLANGISGIAVARPVQLLAGDYNLNGTVDAADYIVWRKNTSQSYEAWRTLFGQSGLSTPVDFNNDGTVDAADYVIWRKTGGIQYDAWRTHFGAPSGAGTGAAGPSPSQRAVPEPASALLCALGVVACGLRTRSKRQG